VGLLSVNQATNQAGDLTDTLRGKVALVTGAARGQGRAHALALARAGADVVVCDVAAQLATAPYPLATPAELEETGRQVEALGRRCLRARVDVRDGEGMATLARRAAAELGGLDVVVANAGMISYGPLLELSRAQWDEVVGVNLTGVWQTCRAAVPVLRDGGAVVVTASTAGLRGVPNIGHYAAAKHGVIGLARSLAVELAPRRIRVNVVAPSTVRTPIVLNQATYTLFTGGHEQATLEDALPAFQRLNTLPVPWIEPEDVAAAVVWLAGDQARHITGAVIPVDAGALLK
jgi:SDR family mycofactocin-dependent oxidoreductase